METARAERPSGRAMLQQGRVIEKRGNLVYRVEKLRRDREDAPVPLVRVAAVWSLAALLAGPVDANDQVRDTPTISPENGLPTLSIDSPIPSTLPTQSARLSVALVQRLVDTAVLVGGKNAADLRKRADNLLHDAGGSESEAVVLQLADDAKRSIVEAAFPKRTTRWEPGISIAILLSVVSLVTSLASLLFLRSATRRALRDAGLL